MLCLYLLSQQVHASIVQLSADAAEELLIVLAQLCECLHEAYEGPAVRALHLIPTPAGCALADVAVEAAHKRVGLHEECQALHSGSPCSAAP